MIRRFSMSHALLAALSVQPMEPKRLRQHGRLFGSGHAVIVTMDRLAKQGLIDVKVTITDKGKELLEETKT